MPRMTSGPGRQHGETMLRKITRKLEKRRRESFRDDLLDRTDQEIIRLGTDYGGWNVPLDWLQEGANAVCIGAGEDISFDIELNARYGMNVVTVDPTPRAGAHVERLLECVRSGERMPINQDDSTYYDLDGFSPDRFTFLARGVWKEDRVMRFFVPRNADAVSHSIVNLQSTDDYFEANCQTLRSLCEDLGIAKIDLLKMDVEGAEYEIIGNMVDDGVLPAVVCVEFDEGQTAPKGYLSRIAETCTALKARGYALRHIEGWNFLFVRGDI